MSIECEQLFLPGKRNNQLETGVVMLRFGFACSAIFMINACALGDVYRAQKTAADDVDAAAKQYEACLRSGEADCERDRRILEVRRGTLDRRAADSERQNAALNQLNDSLQKQNESMQQQQLERDRQRLERDKLRANKYKPSPAIGNIDDQCMNDCTPRYTYAYCQSICSY